MSSLEAYKSSSKDEGIGASPLAVSGIGALDIAAVLLEASSFRYWQVARQLTRALQMGCFELRGRDDTDVVEESEIPSQLGQCH